MTAFREKQRHLSVSPIPPERRIHCNRNLRMERIQAIGFDLDHTLAHYNGPRVEELAYNLTRKRLVKNGYPRKLLEIPYQGDFVIRGLVVDRRRGHILKMDYHNYVTRAYRGRRPLASTERKASYKTGRIRMSTDTYASVDTLFHLPEVSLFAVLVEMHQAGTLEVSPGDIYKDVRAAIDDVHGDGSLKNEIIGNLSTYLRKDSDLALVLEQFRLGGKKLFLLTNSEWYYSNELLGYLLNEGSRNWTDYFDIIGVEAGKPEFFTGKRSFTEEDTGAGGKVRVVSGGNAQEFEAMLDFSGDEVLYFGDHTYGDILRSKRSVGWRTAMVVEELENEVAVSQEISREAEELNYWSSVRDALEAETSQLERMRLHFEKRMAAGENDFLGERLRTVLLNLEDLRGKLSAAQQRTIELGAQVSGAYNPHWGSLFKEGFETSRFGHQVKDFACIYMARVTHFISYGHDHYFRSAKERMPHELD